MCRCCRVVTPEVVFTTSGIFSTHDYEFGHFDGNQLGS
jgi:hypothetical protein